ncbi:MAG TPA: sigma-70 family RNA polymerase sigma factor [Ktedonobacteraceae bacterium]|nr:sigma-70 family RNA polymerase sigma factor [Ktedonobacteraceae bacterium]
MLIQTYEKTNTLSREMTDGVLIQLILAGEQSAFETLVSRYQRPLFNFLCHFLRNSEMACDILQDVFVKLYVSLPTLRTDQPLKPWLFEVARNRSLDELRRKHPICFSQLEIAEEESDVSPVALLPDTNPLPEEIAEHHELQQILRQAIDGLPLKFRQVVLLRYTGRFSFSEIATLLDMPQATAKTYFQRAKPLLRRALFSLQRTA